MSTGELWSIIAAIFSALTATQPAVREPLPPPAITAPAASSCPQWFTLALEVGWPEDDWPTLDRLMWCESRCDEKAHNRSGASGLMQIMPMWHHDRDPFDARTNLTMALEVKALQGWRAWSCY